MIVSSGRTYCSSLPLSILLCVLHLGSPRLLDPNYSSPHQEASQMLVFRAFLTQLVALCEWPIWQRQQFFLILPVRLIH
jgi:hypothetical protein